MKRKTGKVLALVAVLFVLVSPQGLSAEGLRGGFDDAFGPQFHPQTRSAPPDSKHRPRHGFDRASSVRHWNQIAIDASGLDHTPVAPGETRVFGEQLGPGRSSRAIAIVQLAIFEVVNAIEGDYKSYIGLGPVRLGTSLNAAVSQAAHDTLAALFPSQAEHFDELLTDDLNGIPEGRLKSNGIALGKRAASAILAARANDGSQHSEPLVGIEFLTSNDPGKWRQDPISLIPLALGAYWGDVTPFVLDRADQFRVPPPPRLDSPDYAAAYNEVKTLGGDGLVTPTTRTAEQTQIGIFWAYDGTPSLCAPPRLYNQITMRIAHKMGTDTDVMELARLLALVNVAMADAGIAVWESKYYYQYWRPVTGIRESDEHTGPTGLGDGNPATVGDTNYSPLGAPASNLTGPNFTPPFPAYSSGHAGFGGALFEMLRNFYRTDRIPFTFVSDEFNGVTRDHEGNVRPLLERRFSLLSQAEEKNGQSRIYLGIHWIFDKTEGIEQGRRVADYVFKHFLHPHHRR
ncbi:MAG: chloride peroxidase [Nitrospira sp.]|nr:MAG: chloride peroxidase [Nitrospira sp.]